MEEKAKVNVGDYVRITRYDGEAVNTVAKVKGTYSLLNGFSAKYVSGDVLKEYFGKILVDTDLGDEFASIEEAESIHYIYDEELKVKKEYKEVDRSAFLGEIIKITSCEMIHGLDVGSIHNIEADGMVGGWYVEDEDTRDYVVLEPTGVVRSNGKRYKLKDRQAKVGDRILVVKYEGDDKMADGDEDTVGEVGPDGSLWTVESEALIDNSGAFADNYFVMEQVLEPENEEKVATAVEDELMDRLSFLAAEVTKLKNRLKSNEERISSAEAELSLLAGEEEAEEKKPTYNAGDYVINWQGPDVIGKIESVSCVGKDYEYRGKWLTMSGSIEKMECRDDAFLRHARPYEKLKYEAGVAE